MHNNKWVHGLNEEAFNSEYFDTKEEAIEAGKEYAVEVEETYFYVGRCEEYIPSIDIESILNQVVDTAYDNLGEVAEDYLSDISKEAENELEEKLQEVFFEWLKKYKLEPSFYSVINIEKIELEQ